MARNQLYLLQSPDDSAKICRLRMTGGQLCNQQWSSCKVQQKSEENICFSVLLRPSNIYGHISMERGASKEGRQRERWVRRQHQGMDRPGVYRQVPEGSGEQRKLEKNGCKVICGAPTTAAVKRLMMMMMILTTKLLCTQRAKLYGLEWPERSYVRHRIGGNILVTNQPIGDQCTYELETFKIEIDGVLSPPSCLFCILFHSPTLSP